MEEPFLEFLFISEGSKYKFHNKYDFCGGL